MRNTALERIAFILLAIGGINWGLIGLFNFDLVAAIFGPMTVITRIIYLLVGLSGLYSLFWGMSRMSVPARMRPAERR